MAFGTQIYDFTLPANGSREFIVPGASYYRIQSCLGNLAVRRDGGSILNPLQVGQGEQGTPFQRITLVDVSGAANVGTIIISDGTFVDVRSIGATQITNVPTVALLGADKQQLIRPETPSANWNNIGAIAANTPIALFTPGANINGAIVLNCGMFDAIGANGGQTFVAKNAAPASINDGDIICGAYSGSVISQNLQNPQAIAAGQGFYFVSAVAGGATGYRFARYKLL